MEQYSDRSLDEITRRNKGKEKEENEKKQQKESKRTVAMCKVSLMSGPDTDAPAVGVYMRHLEERRKKKKRKIGEGCLFFVNAWEYTLFLLTTASKER